VEGATYTWTREQLEAVLDEDGLEVAERVLGAEPAGGARAVTLHRPTGRADHPAMVDALLANLAVGRARRPQPERDDKRLTAWNAIAARGLMDAGRTFNDSAMLADGALTAHWLATTVVRPDGVVREPDDPSVASVRLLEDAAHLVSALLTAAEVTGDHAMRDRAVALHADTLGRFAAGASLFTTPEDTDLPVRPREGGDSAVPTGSSTAIENAARIGRATGDGAHLDFARAALRQWWAIADFAPEQAGRALAAAVALELGGE
jgi:hypothetical protein